MLEFQKAQMALNEAAVELVEAEEGFKSGSDNSYPGSPFHEDQVADAKFGLNVAARVFAGHCHRISSRKS